MGFGSSKENQQNIIDQPQYFQQHLKTYQKIKVINQFKPFNQEEIKGINKIFKKIDSKGLKYILLQQIIQFPYLRQYILFPRIYQMTKKNLYKMKTEKITLQIFIQLICVFHTLTDIDEKIQYMFKIYDFNNDQRIDKNDMINTLKILFWRKGILQLYSQQEAEKVSIIGIKDIQQMAVKFLASSKGVITLQQWKQKVNKQDVMLLCTINFL